MTDVPRFFADYQQRISDELRWIAPDKGGPVERAMATRYGPFEQVRAVSGFAEFARAN